MDISALSLFNFRYTWALIIFSVKLGQRDRSQASDPEKHSMTFKVVGMPYWVL